MNFIVSGPKEVIDLFHQLEAENTKLSNNSKYPIGTYANLTSDINEIIDALYPAYNIKVARAIARDIAGSVIEVIGVQKLEDDLGIVGTYYSVETGDGCFYVMPESCLEEHK